MSLAFRLCIALGLGSALAWSHDPAIERRHQTLHEFEGVSPGPLLPRSQLLEQAPGVFAGTSTHGGAYGKGTIFSITATGAVSLLHSFAGPEGAGPWGGLVRGPEGKNYGVTLEGGDHDSGTIFCLSSNGTVGAVYSFEPDHHPSGKLVLATDGNLYGATAFGGAFGCGTLFRLSTNHLLETLHHFDGTNGCNLWDRSLVQGADGRLYGTTYGGGADANPSTPGLLFALTTNGAFQVLTQFHSTSGMNPVGTLCAGQDGGLYGATERGGINQGGTVFRADLDGSLSILVSFGVFPTGFEPAGTAPLAGVTQDRDGSLYGTTSRGSTVDPDFGTIFRVTTNGLFSTVAMLDGTNGMNPTTTATLGSDGNLYGTMSDAGGRTEANAGVVYRLTTLPTIRSMMVSATNALLTWDSFSNATYWVQSREALAAGAWQDVSQEPIRAGGLSASTRELPGADNTPGRFFRVRWVP